jgi:transglutaminase-like putative cysteine protease
VAATASRGGRRIAFTALGVALLSPVFVPGFGSKGLVDFGTPAADRIAIDPFVSVQNSLVRADPVEVLRSTADRPGYVRLVTLPVFDGVGWRQAEASDGVPVAPGETLAEVGGRPTAVRIEITRDLLQHFVPAPSPLLSIGSVPGRSVRFDHATGTAFVDDPLNEGDAYTVTTSLKPTPAEALRNVRFIPPTDDTFLQVPDDMSPAIGELAQRWTADADTVFDKVVAIEQRLHSSGEFIYEIDSPLRSGPSSILEFLTQTKRGFCQQFATAMAAMLRSIDIESRVVVGFATGVQTQQPGQYSFSTDLAHAWVEVYFPGWGWMPFEPTPTRTNAVSYVSEPAPCTGAECPTPPNGGAAGEEPGGVGADERAFEKDPRFNGGPRGGPAGTDPVDIADDRPFISVRMALLLGAIAVGLVLLLVPPVRALMRRIRLRRAAAEPRRMILTTYEVFTERAAGMGLGRDAGETLDEYRRKVMESGYLSNGHLDRLTRLTTAAAYSQHEPGEEQALEAGAAADTAIREIRKAVGPAAWFVGLYRGRQT